MMKHIRRAIAVLACLSAVVSLAACGQSNQTNDSATGDDTAQTTQVDSSVQSEWTDAVGAATEAYDQLGKAIDDAKSKIGDATDDEAKSVQSKIDDAQKLYESTTIDSDEPKDANAYRKATDKLTQQTSKMNDAAIRLSDAASSYEKAIEAKKTSLSYTFVNEDGYTYDVSVKGLGMTTSVDTTKGKPGTVMLQYAVADTATFSVTNTTPGKEAPTGLSFGNVYPLFDQNLCELMTGEDKLLDCNVYTINGKQYWSLYEREVGTVLYPHEGTNGSFGVGETVTGQGNIVTDSRECRQEVVDQVTQAIRNPAGWVALTSDKYTAANLGIADDYSGFHFERVILAKTDGIA